VAQRDGDFVGDDPQAANLVAGVGAGVGGVDVGADPAGDQDPVALAEGLRGVLRSDAPGFGVEERGVPVGPLTVVVAAARGGGDPQDGDGLPGRGVAQFGVSGEVAGDGDGGFVHDSCSLGVGG
jgi:hypothetical protein